MINYSLSYRNVKVADLDASGNKQYDTNGDVIKKTVQKAYATHQSIDTMTSEAFCKAIAAMGAYSTADILSIIAVIGQCIRQNVKEGFRVYVGDLGNFYPQISSKGVEDGNTFNPTAHIRKAYVGWVKPQAMRDLSSVTYNLVETQATQKTMNKANKAALSSATIARSSATQSAADNLETLRAIWVLATSVPSNMATMGTASGGGQYKNGTVVQIKATPKEGYAFTKWNDGSREATRNITVLKNDSYTASFAAAPGCVGTKLCKENGDDLVKDAQISTVRLNFTGTAPAAESLSLVKVVSGTETAITGCEYDTGGDGYGVFDFTSPYTVQAGKYRVLKGDVMILEWTIA